MITVPNDYEEPVSPQSSLSEFLQDSTPLTAVWNSLHGSNNSQNEQMEVQGASNSAPLSVIDDSKTRQKNKNSAPASSTSPKRKYFTFKCFASYSESVTKPHLHRDDSLTSQLSTEQFQFKPQLTSLYMVSSPYKFQLNPNRYNDHYILCASKQLAPYEYWSANDRKKLLCKSFFNEFQYLICILMIQIRISNL